MAELDDIDFLLKYPQFEERPASLEEFLGPKYLDLRGATRDSIRKCLSEIFGEEVQTENPSQYLRALLTGGIGIGKTFIASLALTYLLHWTLCLKDPQAFFGLAPGSTIAFMMMSTSEPQARGVIFSEVRTRIKLSPWFRNHPYLGPGGTITGSSQIRNRFEWPDKNLALIPLGSEDTAAEGYNILGGVIDEIDSGKVTDRKVYMKAAYEAIENRISSRYGNRGLIFMIGQRKSQSGYAQELLDDFRKRNDAYAHIMTIWESRGEAYYDDPSRYREEEQDLVGKWFYYDVQRKEVIPDAVIEEGILELDRMETIERIPMMYRTEFELNPEKALRDLAGIPPAVGDPFISYTHKIHECVDRWTAEFGDEPPIDSDGKFAEWFTSQDTLPRVGHVDIGFSGEGDALGLAMGHVRRMVEVNGELKPFIVFDLIMQVTAPAGHEINLHDVRYLIYDLKEHHGFRLKQVTLDGYQSHDFMQQLQRRRIWSDYLSVDKEKLPYFDLKDAIYEDRIAFPPYFVRARNDPTKRIQIAVQELTELTDEGKKIDHPSTGSKDVADAMAGVVFALMGDRRFHRKVTSSNAFRREDRRMSPGAKLHPAYRPDTAGVFTRVPNRPSIAGPPRGVHNPWKQ